MPAHPFLDALKIGYIATDAMNAHLREDPDGLGKGPDDVPDDHVSGDLECAFFCSIPFWH